ncbi:TPA: pyruvate kinase [Candidatus Uhrbacteria bacterium]|nr:pyruvate kinase [Candidatus Uhrbacteria bacterium]
MRQKKHTKIICTIGPSSMDPEMISKMVRAGMNVARLNFSHGSHSDHANLISSIRRMAEETQEPIAIIQDLQGPKVRVGDLPEDGITLEPGKQIILTTDPDHGADRIGVTYDGLHGDVKLGDRLLLDDGLMDIKVTGVSGRDIACLVVTGGVLTSHKGINLPTATLSIPAITDKDREDVVFGVTQKVDWVALSFVRNAKEIYDLRYMIKELERKNGKASSADPSVRIIAKIEKHEAIKNIAEIIEAADGIMIARGDLGIEMPAEEVPLIQKRIIDLCLEAAKPVIVATQMLDSMIRNPRPTRAEVSDVANAVIDHTDAVMLSGESASGKYPLESVETMSRIICETEKSDYDDIEIGRPFPHQDTDQAVSEVANMLARNIEAKLILAASLSGETGRIVSRYRPEMPIVVAVPNDRVRNQMNLSWGVRPFLLPHCSTVEELVDRSLGYLKKEKMVRTGDKIIVVAGEPVGVSGNINLVEIRTV